MNLKKKIHSIILEDLKETVETSKENLDSVRSSAISDTKSSMGDKYETNRAMMQREEAQASEHLSEALKLMNTVDQMNPSHKSKEVETGSLVETSMGNFYFSVAAGKFETEEGKFFAVSPAAPLAKAIWGAKKGDKIKFNGKNVEIRAVI